MTLDDDNKPVMTPGLTYAKLFMTQNLVLEAAADGAQYAINVVKDTDLGAGYLHFAANGRKNVLDVNPAGQSAELRWLCGGCRGAGECET